MIEPESPQRGQQSIFLVWEDGSSWAVSFSAPGCHGGLLITESALLVLTRTPGPSPDHVRVWNSPGELRASGFNLYPDTSDKLYVLSLLEVSQHWQESVWSLLLKVPNDTWCGCHLPLPFECLPMISSSRLRDFSLYGVISSVWILLSCRRTVGWLIFWINLARLWGPGV